MKELELNWRVDMEITMDRGNIHEFLEKDGTVNGRALVVSAQNRCRDNIVNILKLSPVGNGPDAVTVAYNSRDKAWWYVHCGCVSYAYRDRLGVKVGSVSEDTMATVDERIKDQLGLKETVSYKKLYEDMMEKIGGDKDAEL